MDKISIPPSQTPTLARMLELSTSIACAREAAGVLASHPDPIVRYTMARISPAIEAWAASEEAKISALTSIGHDHIGLALPACVPENLSYVSVGRVAPAQSGHCLVVGEHDPLVLATHLRLTRTDNGVWQALSQPPLHSDQASPGWLSWGWTLNGEAVEPEESRDIAPGDVIVLGLTHITLLAPETDAP